MQIVIGTASANPKKRFTEKCWFGSFRQRKFFFKVSISLWLVSFLKRQSLCVCGSLSENMLFINKGSGCSTGVEHLPSELNSRGRGFNSSPILGFFLLFLSLIIESLIRSLDEEQHYWFSITKKSTQLVTFYFKISYSNFGVLFVFSYLYTPFLPKSLIRLGFDHTCSRCYKTFLEEI